MKSLFVITLSIFLLSPAFSQDSDFEKYEHEFGAHAGFTTGLGLSYRHWFDRVGVQLTAIPIKTDDFFLGSIGFSGMYSLKKTKYVRAYLYLGNHFIASNESTYQYDDMGNIIGESTTQVNKYNIGFGPGFSFGKIIAFNLQVGYGLYDVMNKLNMYPTIEMGVYYMF